MKSGSKKAICALGGFVVIVALLFLLVNPRRMPPVVITIKTNGLPYIIGVPLGRGKVRDLTFRLVSRAKVPVNVDADNIPARPGVETNLEQTLNALDKSGLIRLRPSAAPGQFEWER